MDLVRKGKILLEEEKTTANQILCFTVHVGKAHNMIKMLYGEYSIKRDDYFPMVVTCATSINFIDDDFSLGSKPHNRSLFVSRYIRQKRITQILFDEGSTANIFPLRILMVL